MDRSLLKDLECPRCETVGEVTVVDDEHVCCEQCEAIIQTPRVKYARIGELEAEIESLRSQLAKALDDAADWKKAAFIAREAEKELRERAEKAEAALSDLVNAKAIAGVPEMVAGWNGPPDNPYQPHPANLGASIKTTCGRVYELERAMVSARAALKREGSDG
jgi:hypothetical protein